VLATVPFFLALKIEPVLRLRRSGNVLRRDPRHAACQRDAGALAPEGRVAVEYLGGAHEIPVYTAVALVYLLVNVALSQMAKQLERRRTDPRPD
jgi:hypothetical protein